MFENFPYSNFHDLNTDWLIDRVKNVETSEANAKESEENAKASEIASAQSASASAQSAQESAQSASASAQSATASANSATEANDYVTSTRAQVNLLQSRVDNIIPSGTQTEGNTELLDIRVEYNGMTAESAGNAVRDQISTIMSDEYNQQYDVMTSLFEDGYITTGSVNIDQPVNPDNITPSANYKHQIIRCRRGDTFTLSGTGGDAPRIYAFTDLNYILKSKGAANITVTDRVLTAEQDGYFICNINVNSTYSLTANRMLPKIDDAETNIDTLTANYNQLNDYDVNLYINKTSENVFLNDNIIPDNAVKYDNSKCAGLSSSYRPVVETGVSFLVDMPIPDDVKMISMSKFTEAGQMILLYKENTSGVNYTKSAKTDATLIINNNDMIVIDCSVALSRGFERMMISFDSERQSGIYEYKGLMTVKQNLNYVTPLTGLNMFNSVACLGDSYTQGWIVKSDTSAAIAKKPYPAVLHDKLGIDVDNYGVGGTTSKTYITHVDGLPKVLADEAHDLYIICFGINDQNRSMTIGSASDINDADYTQNADTFYGNMGKIVQMLQEQFPLARYVIIGNWAVGLWYAAYNPYNAASKGIAEHFNIPYVNPMNDPFFYSDIFTHDVGGHPTQVGYTGIAYAVERLMSKCIAENYEYYRYAGVETI